MRDTEPMKTETNGDIDLMFYSKRHTWFDLRRLVKAKAQTFPAPITAYLCGVFITSRTGVGVVFGHLHRKANGFFEDGHLIRTSDVMSVQKEGKFWVMTTKNSRYVIATFQRAHGRASLREFLRLSNGQHHLSPHQLQ